MRKIRFLLTIFFLSGGISLFSQTETELKVDKSSSRTAKEFFSKIQKRTLNGFGIGWRQASFYNNLFYQNVKNGDIKKKGGFEVSYFLNITPVMFDVTYFQSGFNVNAPMYYPDQTDKVTRLQGIEAYLSYAPLLPDLGKFSEIVTPYIGIGYQTSSLRVSKSDKSYSDESLIGSKGTSSPVWKGGIRLNLKNFFIKGEYKQSLRLTKPEAMNVFAIVAGVKI